MSNRRIVLPGIILGVVVLALAAVFAIVLPKVNGETDDLSLPATLPGGYTASDLAQAWKGAPGATDDKIDQAAASERTSRDYGDKTLAAAGVDAVTRTYVGDDYQTYVVVQAFRAQGGAFSPFQFTDPANAESGQEIQHLVKHGDAVCIEFGSADGQGGSQASYVECQKSEGDYTVQVTSQLELDEAVKLVDVVYDELV